MNVNFGKYDIPPTLQRVMLLQEELDDQGHFYLGMNFYLSLDNFRYFNTPSDVVVFGNSGCDGIHYGFLTDYGSVDNLETAPIVCVSPMDFDRPTRIVANNLAEFLRVNGSDSALFYNEFESEKDYIMARQQWDEESENSLYPPSENDKLVQENILTWISDNIYMPEIDKPYHYIQDVRNKRQERARISTQDGLGIVHPLLEGEKHISFNIDKNKDLNVISLQEFLDSAPFASRLAVFRDIQQNHVLPQEPELNRVVVDAMNSMGLMDEAQRLMSVVTDYSMNVGGHEVLQQHELVYVVTDQNET